MMTKKSRTLALAAAGLMLAAGVALAGSHGGAKKEMAAPKAAPAMEDTRTFVELPQPQRDTFLALMRGFMESLDDINTALAEGNFKEVARIAKEDMGPAHEIMAVLRKAKVPEEKIAQVVEKAREAMQQIVEKGQGRPMIGRIVMQVLGDPPPEFLEWKKQHMKTGGLGRFLPPEMHVMGIQMHLNAAKLGDVAAQVSDKPTVEDYKKVIGAVGEITAQCRACHAAYKVMK